jgi:hypothetical protein
MRRAITSRNEWQRPAEPDVIRDFVNFSLPAGCTHADVIQETAKHLGWRVQSLPESLNHKPLFRGRGRVVFGSASKVLDEIVAEEKSLYWNLSDGVLRFEVRDTRIDLSPFDELAGRLMHSAKRGDNGRILPDEYLRITSELVGFRPTDFLEGRDRKSLATWNQTHPRAALHAFSDAYKNLRFRRAVLRRFKRAEAKYRKAHYETAGPAA